MFRSLLPVVDDESFADREERRRLSAALEVERHSACLLSDCPEAARVACCCGPAATWAMLGRLL